LEPGAADDMMAAAGPGEEESMARFAATTSDVPGGLRVALAGDCDMAVREELTATLLAAVGRSTSVVVDLAEVDFLDSSGVHGLIAAHRAALERGGHIYLENPTGSVAAVLDLTGVGPLLGCDGDTRTGE
jgi:anti-anti-sigma factor